jgi:hypothetical protein
VLGKVSLLELKSISVSRANGDFYKEKKYML